MVVISEGWGQTGGSKLGDHEKVVQSRGYWEVVVV